MSGKRGHGALWAILATGPILGMVTFVVGYYIDPLNFGEREPLAAVPALMLGVFAMLVTHSVTSFLEVERLAVDSERIHQAVQSYLHVTKVGTPRTAWEYIISRMPALEEVQNTSFNLADEEDRVRERLYESESYQRGPRTIADAVNRGLRWKDIGDASATSRLRQISAETSKGRNPTYYEFKRIAHDEPQITFTVLTFADGSREVLFNWDYRAAGQEPTVLLSRDQDIVSMFAIQFEHLWRKASNDHDNSATRSTSKK